MCQVLNCSNVVKAKGLCNNHYAQAFKLSLLENEDYVNVLSALSLFEGSVVKNDSDCKLWNGLFKDDQPCVKIENKDYFPFKILRPLYNQNCLVRTCTTNNCVNLHHHVECKKTEYKIFNKEISEEILDRFFNSFEELDKTLCWVWQKSQDEDGYGKFSVNGFWVPAHRFSYLIHKGFIEKGLCVCHSCDNPSCVNPHHLWLGTIAENIKDCVDKKRHSYGEKNAHAKLTTCQVMNIINSSIPGVRLAELYGVTLKAVSEIRRGVNWKHLSRDDKQSVDTSAFRHLKADKHPNAKLSESDIRTILLSPHLTDQQLSENLKCSRTLITLIRQGKRYKSLTDKIKFEESVELRVKRTIRTDLHVRTTVGENHPNSKLTNADVLQILKSEESFENLAKRYGVSYYTIRNIKLRRSWKNVTLD